MMLRKVDSVKKNSGDPGTGRLLHEIEAISKALYVNKNPSKSSVSSSDARSKSTGRSHFPEPKLKPRFVKEEQLQKDKKPSIWNWKPLKALSHIRHRRFNCSLSLEVHSIEGLPSNFNNFSLCVYWKRRDGLMQTKPVRVFQGIAEFEETLMHRCSIFGSGNGPHHSAKYEAKHCLLYASVVNAPELDIGKHRMDLTRLLPVTFEELEEEKSTGKWTTSYKLSGKAKGATLNVSFGFSVIMEDTVKPGSNRNPPESMDLKLNKLRTMKSVTGYDRGDNDNNIQHGGSLLGIANQRRSHLPSRSLESVKTLHEVLPTAKLELSNSVNMLYLKFDQDKLDSLDNSNPDFEAFSEHVEPLKPKTDSLSETAKENCENEVEDTEFTVIEQGIEISTNKKVNVNKGSVMALDASSVGTIEHTEINESGGEACEEDISNFKENDICRKESVMEELESVIDGLSISDSCLVSPSANFESPEQVNYLELKANYKSSKVGKSLSLDDVTESVASEFLNMLGIEHSPFVSSDSDPESPRERLLRQFEKESLAGGSGIFSFDLGNVEKSELEFGYDSPSESRWREVSDDFELSSVLQATEAMHQIPTQAVMSKNKAKMLEDLETEALMREWGLNEKIFQNSPPNSSGGFGSPIHFPPEEPLELPPLCEGLGPFLQTKDGGFLRSMSPSTFSNAKNGGKLIMQTSSPIVVPAEMGSGVMEILQSLASIGIEKLSVQANKLMPLEDITGKTMEQVAWEVTPSLEAPERKDLLQFESEIAQDLLSGKMKGKKGVSHGLNNLNSSSFNGDAGSEYVSLEDLAPLAMDKIEALSIEGLRIQSGMTVEEAPSNISSQSIGQIPTLEGKRTNFNGSLGMEGAAGLQLLDIKHSGEDVDGLMGLSLTLDEWMKLDAGILDDEDQISDRTSKILAAHHATCTDLIGGGWKDDRRRGKGSGRKYGLLGNNFTVALMVQLRDPLRNYEPVGAPMLALIQVERVFVPPKPKIYRTVSENRNSNEEDDESELVIKEVKDELKEEKVQEECIPQFKITEVHVAGLKTDPGKKKLWGTPKQQQSGSRWLVASGMGKSNKHPFMKSNTVAKSTPQATTTVQPGDTLWSISSRVHGTGAKWKELAALNPHIRNPNVIFPNEKIRLR